MIRRGPSLMLVAAFGLALAASAVMAVGPCVLVTCSAAQRQSPRRTASDPRRSGSPQGEGDASAQARQETEAAARIATLAAQARQHFDVGNSLFQAGRFSEAVREFLRAFELSRRPELQYNVYVSARDASDVRTAAAALRAYLAAMPSAVPVGVPSRPQLKARLQSLEQPVAAQEAAEREREDERRAQEEAVARAEEARRRAEEERRRVEEERRRVEAERRRIAAEGGVSLPGLLVGGVGVAALATGTITGLLALGETASLEEHCMQGFYPASARTTYESARLLVTLTGVFLASGVLLTATGVTMLLLGFGTSGGGASAHRWRHPPSCAAPRAVPHR